MAPRTVNSLLSRLSLCVSRRRFGGKHLAMRTSIVVMLIIVGVGVKPAAAHHPSGISGTGQAGPIITLGAATIEAGKSAAQITFEFTEFDALSDGVLIDAAGRHEHVHCLDTISSPAFSFAYGVTDNLMLAMRLPYVERTGIREGSHEHHAGEHMASAFAAEFVENSVVDRGDTDGIGDLTLLAQYRFLRNGSGFEAAALFGVKSPTGETRERDDEGERFDAEFQPGSGSWDGLFGLALSKSVGRWALDGNLLYSLVTEGMQDTDLGDRVQYNAALSYRLIGHPTEAHLAHRHHDDAEQQVHPHAAGAVDLVLEFNGEWHDEERTDGESDRNSGGTTVYLSPGLRLVKNDWSGFVSVGLPIVNYLNGIQAEPSVRIVAGAAVAF